MISVHMMVTGEVQSEQQETNLGITPQLPFTRTSAGRSAVTVLIFIGMNVTMRTIHQGTDVMQTARSSQAGRVNTARGTGMIGAGIGIIILRLWILTL